VTVDSDGSALCTACGLCCDGTLFGFMPVEPDEHAIAARAGVAVSERRGIASVPLPCTYLDGACCTIYGHNYRICSTFRCKLLRARTAAKIDADAALAHVAEAQRLRNAFVSAARDAGITGDIPAIRRTLREGGGPTNPATAWPRLQQAALDVYLAQHFSARERRTPFSG
jgi:hypothetical protein